MKYIKYCLNYLKKKPKSVTTTIEKNENTQYILNP